ncbi:PKD domain-containing protein [Paraglaciecola aquimarina]|uniref:PKD domain-containing protein n=1 Tax=Paraglaciecola algarum TaxID=3050085 RepID=A0ABS9D5U5_9ALTE|nr:PKD domain-containing protein [Paraglaciecola sp. G1-23]MCF2947392.1 PKD domain-containing protein [Paraglaciecola sp. G1-23]
MLNKHQRISVITVFLSVMIVACWSGCTPQPSNIAPTANAGSDQRVKEQSSATLSGLGTDSDGSISSYSWTQTSGTSVTIENATSARATFVAPDLTADEILTFQLTVTDNNNATATDTVDIAVQNINQSPTANAGSNQAVNEQANVILSGSGTDADGAISSYSWTQTSGTSVILIDTTLARATFIAPDITKDETLTFQLTVTDNDNATATDTVDIRVQNLNQPPTANAGNNQAVKEQTRVTLSGLGTDSDGSISSYRWNQISGTSVTVKDANSARATFVAPAITKDETLTFQLTVTDNDNATATDTVNIAVQNINQPTTTKSTIAKPRLPVSAHNCKIVKSKLDGMLERERVGSSTPAHAKRLRFNIEMFEELKQGCLQKGLAVN